jgi:hypothetical protein
MNISIKLLGALLATTILTTAVASNARAAIVLPEDSNSGDNPALASQGDALSGYTGLANDIAVPDDASASFNDGLSSDNRPQPEIPDRGVPEPTTLISGALLLLPFGSRTLRRFLRNRAR